jgi:glucosamine-6-phosphate deaminase
MKPRTIIFQNKKEIYNYTTTLIKKEIEKKTGSVLALPTGKTVIPLYKNLIKLYKQKKIDFSKVKTFNLDEYLGIDKKHTFRYFMDKKLFSKLNLKKENIYFLPSRPDNPKKSCEFYEKQIKKFPIDFEILGLGVNGHIAFNEPSSPFNSRTRKIKLSQTTKNSNKISCDYALTMGISTIMKSKKILLIATGEHKSKAVRNMLKGPITAKCPASFLRKHKNVLILLDKAAASHL